MSLAAHGQSAIAAYVLGSVAASLPSTWYVGLLDATSTELTTANSPGYARVALTNNTTNFVLSGSFPTTVANGVAVTFPTATGKWPMTSWFGLWDAISGGNLWIQGMVTLPTATAVGNQANFPIGTLVTQWS